MNDWENLITTAKLKLCWVVKNLDDYASQVEAKDVARASSDPCMNRIHESC